MKQEVSIYPLWTYAVSLEHSILMDVSSSKIGPRGVDFRVQVHLLALIATYSWCCL